MIFEKIKKYLSENQYHTKMKLISNEFMLGRLNLDLRRSCYEKYNKETINP